MGREGALAMANKDKGKNDKKTKKEKKNKK